MNNENNTKKRRNIIAVVLVIAIVLVIGATVSYFYNSYSVNSVFTAKTFSTVVTHSFTAPPSFKPGTTTTANLNVKNEGTTPVAVRAKITEKFVAANAAASAESDGTSTTLADGSDVVLKETEEGWVKNGQYYYYTTILNANATTNNLVSQVIFNKLAGDVSNTNINPSTGAITYNGCTENLDHTYTCENASPYDNKGYVLTVEFEMLQASAYKSEWSVDFDTLKSLSQKVKADTTTQTSGTIKYYTANTNNNVILGNNCYQILRTTATDGVKMIYNGAKSGNTCPGTNNSIGTSVFGETTSYMGTNGVNNNTINSTVKTLIDTWYTNNLASYTNILEDTTFINDRTGTKTTSSTSLTGSVADTFSVGTLRGNGALKFPVGLITMDEAVMATFISDGALTMTAGASDTIYITDSGSATASSLETSGSIRPVISVKGYVKATGTGTSADPYVLS